MRTLGVGLDSAAKESSSDRPPQRLGASTNTLATAGCAIDQRAPRCLDDTRRREAGGQASLSTPRRRGS
jgi:hypothetical protein